MGYLQEYIMKRPRGTNNKSLGARIHPKISVVEETKGIALAKTGTIDVLPAEGDPQAQGELWYL